MPQISLFRCNPIWEVLQIGIKSQGYREPDTVMSDSDESGVTYTEEPPSLDYVPGLEEPEQALPSPDYVPGLEHADDEEEEDPFEDDTDDEIVADLEEDDDEDPEEDPINYPADRGDDGDDEMDIEEDEANDMDIEADEEDEDDDMDVEAGEEEHLAPTDSIVVVLPATVPSAEETDPFETDESAATPPPHPAYRMTARITILEPLPVPAWSEAEVARLLAISITTIITTPRPDAPLSPPLLPPSASHKEDRPEVTLLPQKRVGIALGPRYEVGESSATAAARLARGLRADYSFVATMDSEIRHDPKRYVGYGIKNTWDEIVETLQGGPVSTDTELVAHVREFESMVRRDTDEIYTMLSDEQDQRQLLATRVNMLFRDRRAHAHIRQLIETEARMSSSYSQLIVGAADYSDIDYYADSIEGDDSTSRTGHHIAGAGDSLAGTGYYVTGTGCYLTGTAGTRYRSYSARAARGGS
ncbi:hypothetical protein Tco_1418263 [Tanacetum coccineum]